MNPPVIVALGSNLGDSTNLLIWAMDRIATVSKVALRRSSIWTSTPLECPLGSPVFLNAVVELIPLDGITPEGFLEWLKQLETEAGRLPKKVMNEARPLDLDIISWGEVVWNSLALILPHPRAYCRRFVLQPLVELAPDRFLPGHTLSMRELLNALPPDALMRRVETAGLSDD